MNGKCKIQQSREPIKAWDGSDIEIKDQISSETNRKYHPSKHFSSFSSTFPLSLPKTPSPIKTSFSKLTKIGLSLHKGWSHEIINCSLTKYLNLGAFLATFFSIIGNKALGD